MKLSEIKLEDVQGMYMHYDEQDCVRRVETQATLDDIKELLMGKFGDVDIEIINNRWGGKEVTITSENWIAAHKAFTDEKQAWCDKYGCD